MEVIEITLVVSAATLLLLITGLSTYDHFRRLFNRYTVE